MLLPISFLREGERVCIQARGGRGSFRGPLYNFQTTPVYGHQNYKEQFNNHFHLPDITSLTQ